MGSITRDFVSVAYIVKDKKVLLIKHKKIGLWLPPGGHIDENETPEQAAIREIKEETGLDIILDTEKFHKIQILRPHHVEIHPIAEGHEHICFTYFTKAVGGKMIQNTKETDGFKWFSKEELDSNGITIEVKTFAKQAIEGVK